MKFIITMIFLILAGCTSNNSPTNIKWVLDRNASCMNECKHVNREMDIEATQKSYFNWCICKVEGKK